MLAIEAAGLPPEANHTAMAGPGPGGTVTWATLMETLANELTMEASAKGYTTATTAEQWIGISGAAMAASAVPEIAHLFGLAAHCHASAGVASGVALAYSDAFGSMIPSPVALSNRSTQAGLVASNVFGQNTPAINFLDGMYFGGFWPQNAGLRMGYGGVLDTAIAALSVPPPVGGLPADPAAQAAAGAAVQAEQAGQTGLNASMRASSEAAMPMDSPMMGQMSSIMSMAPSMIGQFAGMIPQFMSTVMQPLTSLPQQAMGLFSPMLSSLSSGMAGLGSGATSALSSAPGALGSAGSGLGSGLSSAIGATRPVGAINSVGGGLGMPAGWSPAALKSGKGPALGPAGGSAGSGGMYAPMAAARRHGEESESSTSEANGQIKTRLPFAVPVVTAGAGEN